MTYLPASTQTSNTDTEHTARVQREVDSALWLSDEERDPFAAADAAGERTWTLGLLAVGAALVTVAACCAACASFGGAL